MSKVKSIKSIGLQPTFDLEVDHPDHQYFLSNGLLTSNSHSILYSLTSFKTAYLKAHFPLEFLTSNLMAEVRSNSLDRDVNIQKLKSEIRKMNVRIIPPDINTSEMTYKIIDDNTLMTGFDALKFMGKKSVPEIIEKRPYTSFDDFLTRVDGRKVTSQAIQAMAASGALDSFGLTRQQMFLHAQDYKKKIALYQKRVNKSEFKYPWPDDVEEWTIPEKFAMETKYLGEGLCGNKFQVYPGFFSKQSVQFSKFSEIYPQPDNPDGKFLEGPSFIIQGEIKDVAEFKVKKEDSKSLGQPMGRITLEDAWGNQCGMSVFPKVWPDFKKRVKQLLKNKGELAVGLALSVKIKLNWYNSEVGMVFDDLLRVAESPALPSDLKHRKVSMKITGRKKKIEEPVEDLNAEDVLEEVEDEMVEEGFLDMHDEDLDDVPDFFN